MENHNLLSSEQMRQFLNRKDIPDIQVDFIETTSLETSTAIYCARLKKTQVLSAEHAWFAISSAIDDDLYQMINREFAPISYQEYYFEALKWAQYCNVDIQKFFPASESLLSILRVEIKTNSSEYLLQYESEYAYILVEINVS